MQLCPPSFIVGTDRNVEHMDAGPCKAAGAIEQPWTKNVSHPRSKTCQVVEPFAEMPLRRKCGPYQVVGTEIVWKREVKLHSAQNASNGDGIVPGMYATVESAGPGTFLPAAWCLQQGVRVREVLTDMSA